MITEESSSGNMKGAEKAYKEMKVNQQEWSSNAMLYLLKLTLMALAGYVQQKNSQSGSAAPVEPVTNSSTNFPPTPVKQRTSSAPSFAAHDDPARTLQLL